LEASAHLEQWARWTGRKRERRDLPPVTEATREHSRKSVLERGKHAGSNTWQQVYGDGTEVRIDRKVEMVFAEELRKKGKFAHDDKKTFRRGY
jgi:hypothetical protein